MVCICLDVVLSQFVDTTLFEDLEGWVYESVSANTDSYCKLFKTCHCLSVERSYLPLMLLQLLFLR